MSSFTDKIVESLTSEYDEAVRDLSVDAAMEVTSSLISNLQAALMGLNDDLAAQG